MVWRAAHPCYSGWDRGSICSTAIAAHQLRYFRSKISPSWGFPMGGGPAYPWLGRALCLGFQYESGSMGATTMNALSLVTPWIGDLCRSAAGRESHEAW